MTVAAIVAHEARNNLEHFRWTPWIQNRFYYLSGFVIFGYIMEKRANRFPWYFQEMSGQHNKWLAILFQLRICFYLDDAVDSKWRRDIKSEIAKQGIKASIVDKGYYWAKRFFLILCCMHHNGVILFMRNINISWAKTLCSVAFTHFATGALIFIWFSIYT